MVRNKKTRAQLEDVVQAAGAEAGCEKAIGMLLSNVASRFPAQALAHRPALLSRIMSGAIHSSTQLEHAFLFLKKTADGHLDEAAFEAASGVGIVISEAEIRAACQSALDEHRDALVEERYVINTNPILAGVTKQLMWADGALTRQIWDEMILALLGPKTEEDERRIEEKKKAPKGKKGKGGGGGGGGGGVGNDDHSKNSERNRPVADAATPTGTTNNKTSSNANATNGGSDGVGDHRVMDDTDVFAFLPQPADNTMVHTTVPFSDGHVMRITNTPTQLAEHLARTGGKHKTRFPPEPNGYLHIGHAKAMFIDFGMAKEYGGDCYLRYDDTNPEAEKQEFIDHIEDIVDWMGWKPWKITHASDQFDALHALAVKLIEKGLAYVCHQTKDEISVSREKREPSPWRDTPVAENLRKFADMRRGLYAEGEVSLRMKQDVKNNNFNMFDLIAYRIKYVEHPKAGRKWCIYPSYDFTHCINDSLEDITHSLCTLEFEPRRASYYWLLEVLDLYKPVVYEYSRLNITHIVLSKRKLQQLVYGGYVDGWTDPRLPTLGGMRRRGYTPKGINAFIRDMGFSRTENMVYLHKLEYFVRQDLEASSPRRFAVLDPLLLTLTNVDAKTVHACAARHFPGVASTDLSEYLMPLTRDLLIERSDFREVDEKGYYGLAPGKMGMLRYAAPIKVTGCEKDPQTGTVTRVLAEYCPEYAGKVPKGVLHWVSADPQHHVPAEVRLFDVMFAEEDVGALGETWLDHFQSSSKEVLPHAVCTPAMKAAKPRDSFQFERLGYFCVDDESTTDKLIINRTVTLRDSRK